MQRHNDVSNVRRIDTTAGGFVSTRIWIVARHSCLRHAPERRELCREEELVVRPECPSLDAEDYYFPKGALDPSRSKVDGITRDWYSKYLRAMMEPSLSCGQGPDGFAYRFLWLRSSHHPIAVRVEKDGSSVTLNAVELDGTGEQCAGRDRQADAASLVARASKTSS